MYNQNGVRIEDTTLYEGGKAKLKYNGYLHKNGAEEIYVHVGFGLLWEDLTEIKMTKHTGFYEANIPLVKADTLNFCFRDNSNNWDNNFYQNYSYEVKRVTKAQSTLSSAQKISNIDINSIDVNNTIKKRKTKRTGMIDSLDLTKDSVSSVKASQSLVPIINSEFMQYRRLPENYIRNKRMRVLFYRMFSYVPRLLNGYNKKRAKEFLKK
ncbi:MAG: carbohydrate-binding protein [Deltaproteobacteria bacterium]